MTELTRDSARALPTPEVSVDYDGQASANPYKSADGDSAYRLDRTPENTGLLTSPAEDPCFLYINDLSDTDTVMSNA